MILAVKSGLTGLAQISGRKDLSWPERRKLDLYYVQNWSMWLDLVILAKTVRVVVHGRGAK
jgi:lipopolysaccharide/colanic/teichoic acid biosynthesis glycosyltransferase